MSRRQPLTHSLPACKRQYVPFYAWVVSKKMLPVSYIFKETKLPPSEVQESQDGERFFGLSVLLFIGAWRFDKYRCFIIDLHLQKFGFFDNYKSLEVHGYQEMPHRVCNTFQTLLSHRHRSPLRDCAARGTGRLVLATLKPTKLSNTPRSLLILHLLWGLLHHILAPTTAQYWLVLPSIGQYYRALHSIAQYYNQASYSCASFYCPCKLFTHSL